MQELRIQELTAATEAYAPQIEQFLALADFLYNDLGIIGEVHSRIDGDSASYSLILIDRPSTSVQITKTFNNDGTQTDWKAVDLTDHI